MGVNSFRAKHIDDYLIRDNTFLVFHLGQTNVDDTSLRTKEFKGYLIEDKQTQMLPH